MAAVTGFFHGGITVSDMDRALVFYRDGLGLEQEFDRILDAPYLPAVLGLEFDAHPGGLPAHPRRRLRGAARVRRHRADVRRVAALRLRRRPPVPVRRRRRGDARPLVELGFAARSEQVVDITAGPNAGARSCYMADPDGYAVELFQKRPGA